MRPITLAHTTVVLPKYGASSRDAQISVASDPAPAANTTNGSARGVGVTGRGATPRRPPPGPRGSWGSWGATPQVAARPARSPPSRPSACAVLVPPAARAGASPRAGAE